VIKAFEKGLHKIMSKMGISAVASYRGAQIFEAVGLHPAFVEKWFPGTISRISGIGLEHVAADVNAWHHTAHAGPLDLAGELDEGGIYQWRRRGERHRYDPPSVALLQHAVRQNSASLYKRYAAHVNAEEGEPLTLRALLDLVPAGPPVPLDEVEPVESLVRRFKTGAMSYGSISKEAHENLAIAMNRLGGRSNTGEGGEDPGRYVPDANGDSRRSAIKQVASARFGVTLEYLLNADELQIKMAQGAKPGEGGQLPGHKVDATIARLRYCTAGVGLISPPPHHDIYSIEDLAQLISDLRHANPRARISVKLVSEAGVGTVAAGVAKAGADLILISGDSGGTGASPLSSIRHAGLPWELGLAETQQALVANGLRGRVRLETDGQLRTGRDVALAAALGAEEFGFATAALVASGCILMRACHLNTCPVGIATQDPQLRARFEGKPEHVENFMRFVAQEVREVLAHLGLRRLDELVGRTELLAKQPSGHPKASALDLSPLLHRAQSREGQAIRFAEGQPDWLEGTFDRRVLAEWAAGTLAPNRPLPVENTDRSIGTLLAAERALAVSESRPAPGPAHLELLGIAGQSLGAFLPEGMSIRLVGQANDYFGKGLSGGRLVVVPPEQLQEGEERALRVGNVCLYGATSGEAFIRGRGGERFAVRNSGAVSVVEGVGDHGCEYMTSGEIVILGPVGRNFAAGMSGGYAYVYDPNESVPLRLNPEMVECEPLGPEASHRVRTLLQRHAQLTGSPLAWWLLGRWESEARAAFVHVIPTEYRRALAGFDRAQASGS
jgi:glutamate synthase domain-containing protein 2/glutamate synthase domain-containing protein 3